MSEIIGDILFYLGWLLNVKISNNLDKHISMASCRDVAEICKPLLEYFPIKCFAYSRVYPDGSRMELNSHPEFLRHTFIQLPTFRKIYTPVLVPQGERYNLTRPWIEKMKGPARKPLLELINRQHCDLAIGNTLTINTKHINYQEYFQFSASSHKDNMESFYINNMDMLERFANYFRHTAHELIKKADKNRLIKPWRNQHAIEKDISNKSGEFDKSRFIQATTPKHLILMINDREVQFSHREMECASFLLKGKTARGIATELSLSPRTIESYLETMKLKTGCDNRSEFIEFLQRSDIRTLLLAVNRSNLV